MRRMLPQFSTCIALIYASTTSKHCPLDCAVRCQSVSPVGPVLVCDGFALDYSSSDISEPTTALQNTNTRPL